MRKTALLAAALGVCAPGLAWAQTEQQPAAADTKPNRVFSISGHVVGEGDYSFNTLYNDEVSTELESGVIATGAYGFRIDENTRVQFGLTYRSHESGESTFLFDTTDEVSFTAVTVDAAIYYDVPTGGPVRPYFGALAGVGYGDVNDALLDSGGEAIRLRGMAGVSVGIGERAAFFVEAGYDSAIMLVETYALNDEDDAEYDTLMLGGLSVGAGFRTAF